MKTKRITYSILTVLIMAFSLNSCVEDTDYETPQVNCEEPILAGTEVSMTSIIQNWEAANQGEAGEVNISFDDDVDSYITGYVISSDKTGNFYKEVFIQDDPSNPTAGIKLAVDMSDLHTKYDLGRKIYIYLKGLALGKSHGELVLGKEENGFINNMTEGNAKNNILRNCEAVALTAVSIASPSEINDSHLGKYVSISNVQFTDNLIGKTYVAPEDLYDTHRALISCADGNTIMLETSTYASFDNNPLPAGKGSINGIISRDYRDDYFVLRINSPEDVVFTEERCGAITITPTMTMAEFMDNYNGEISPSEEIVFEAYVISNDAAGNFYKNIYVQDAIENPTVGLQILIGDKDLYQQYPVGSKIYIKPGGLYKGLSYGIPSLGYYSGDYPEQISSGEAVNYVINSGETFDITPVEIHFDGGALTQNKLDDDGNPIPIDATHPEGPFEQEAAPSYILAQLDNMQLNRDELGSAYSYFHGTASANRKLFNCDTDNIIIMRNSGYADFANTEFPVGKGSIIAVLSSYNGTPQLYIRDTNDLSFTGERCDPVILDCGIASNQGSNNIFNDDFESQLTNSPISGNGWTNYIEAGTQTWSAYNSTGSNPSLGISARMGSHSSGDASSIAWLITPEIDFDAQDGETLVFKTSNSYADSSSLDLLFSTDWDGDIAHIADATWGLLPAAYIVQDSDSYPDWLDSGIVDLSCAEGTMYIAFKYTGSGDNDFDGTYELDEISIDYTP